MMHTIRSWGISMCVNNVALRVSRTTYEHVFDFIDIDINAKESF